MIALLNDIEEQGSYYRLDEDCTELFESILDCKNKIEELDSEVKEENSQDKNQLMTKVKNLDKYKYIVKLLMIINLPLITLML